MEKYLLQEVVSVCSNLQKEEKEESEVISEPNFANSCEFIDNSGLNLYTQRYYGRSGREMPTKGILPTAKGATITFLGAIS